MIYNVLISGVQQRDSVIHIYIFFLKIRFSYRLLQDIAYSCLCYTVGPCWLSILYIWVVHFKWMNFILCELYLNKSSCGLGFFCFVLFFGFFKRILHDSENLQEIQRLAFLEGLEATPLRTMPEWYHRMVPG